MKDWGSSRIMPDFKLPGPNPFVPKDLSVIVPKKKVLKPGEKVAPPNVVDNLAEAGGWKVCAGRNLLVDTSRTLRLIGDDVHLLCVRGVLIF